MDCTSAEGQPAALRWGLADCPVLLYAGNLGLTQDFDLLLDARRSSSRGVEVIIAGGGARSDLSSGVNRRSASNVRLEAYLPEAEVPDLLDLSDVVAVPLKPGYDRTITPAKIYWAMAPARPTVATCGQQSDCLKPSLRRMPE